MNCPKCNALMWSKINVAATVTLEDGEEQTKIEPQENVMECTECGTIVTHEDEE